MLGLVRTVLATEVDWVCRVYVAHVSAYTVLLLGAVRAVVAEIKYGVRIVLVVYVPFHFVFVPGRIRASHAREQRLPSLVQGLRPTVAQNQPLGLV